MFDSEANECCICFSILVEPIRIACNHIYCLICLEKIIVSGDLRCPMDRKIFDYLNDLKYDKSIVEKNLEQDPKGFYERANRIYEFRQNVNHMEEMTLNYGNFHTLLNTTEENCHQWCAFVSLKKLDNQILDAIEKLKEEANIEQYVNVQDNYREFNNKMKSDKPSYDNIEADKVIKKVTFKLHPSFTQNIIPITEVPFKITRIGWAPFNVTITVEFHDKLNIETVELDHFLSFNKDLSEGYRKIFVDMKKVFEP